MEKEGGTKFHKKRCACKASELGKQHGYQQWSGGIRRSLGRMCNTLAVLTLKGCSLSEKKNYTKMAGQTKKAVCLVNEALPDAQVAKAAIPNRRQATVARLFRTISVTARKRNQSEGNESTETFWFSTRR